MSTTALQESKVNYDANFRHATYLRRFPGGRTTRFDSGAGAGEHRGKDSGAVLEEIVVTATKRSERLGDVPVAVTAITSEQIETRGYTNYADYLNSVPNVWMQDVGPGQTQLYIRGLVAQGGSGFPVASYFGEAVTSIITNNGGFANMRLVDIERVEVLRGPQGTLFGANSLAGVIRIVPNAPNLTTLGGNIDVRGWSTAHSDDLSEHVEGALNLPIVNDKFALRFVAYQDKTAGYIDNVVPTTPDFDYSAALGAPPGTLVIPGTAAFTRKDINSLNTWGARVAGTFKPSDQLKIDFSYAAQGVTLDSEPPVQPAVGRYNVQRALDKYEHGISKEDERIGQLVINYDWSNVTLTAASSYIQLKRYSSQDIGFLAANQGLGNQLWSLQDSSAGDAFTQELRLASRGTGPLQWLAGAFYSNGKFDLGQFVPDYSCPTCLPTVLAGQDFAIKTIGNPIGEKQRQKSLFGEVSYDFTPQWTVGVGARYLEDSLEAFSPAVEGFLAGGSVAASPPGGRRQYRLESFGLPALQAGRRTDVLPAGRTRLSQWHRQPGAVLRPERSLRRDGGRAWHSGVQRSRQIVDLRTRREDHFERRPHRHEHRGLPPEVGRRAAGDQPALRFPGRGERRRRLGRRRGNRTEHAYVDGPGAQT